MTVMGKIAKGSASAGTILGLSGAASLRTPCGERRIENIRVGDLVVTRDQGLQPVRLVWTRTVTAAEMAADPSLAPVRLKPRAIGPMMPQRDLLVAGDHRILIPGYRLADVPDTQSCLLAARRIAELSDDAYVDKSLEEVTFYNLVFDSHQVFCSNGLPVESYLPSSKTLGLLDKNASSDLVALFPKVKRSKSAYPAADYPAPGFDHRPELV